MFYLYTPLNECTIYLPLVHTGTGDFIKKVLSVYTHSMATNYLSISAQVAKSTFFMKSPVAEGTFFHEIPCISFLFEKTKQI